MANYTDITVLMDRSGSMEVIKVAMEKGFKEFLQGHRKFPSTRLSLIQFDGENPYEEVYINKPVLDAPNLCLSPRGMTPLVDATCKAIDATGRRLAAMCAADRPERVIFVTITDGEENASRLFKRDDVRRRVEHQESVYKWEFNFIGAGQDAFAEAATYGYQMRNVSPMFVGENATFNMFKAITAKTVGYAATATLGTQAARQAATMSSTFTQEDIDSMLVTDDTAKTSSIDPSKTDQANKSGTKDSAGIIS